MAVVETPQPAVGYNTGSRGAGLRTPSLLPRHFTTSGDEL